MAAFDGAVERANRRVNSQPEVHHGSTDRYCEEDNCEAPVTANYGGAGGPKQPKKKHQNKGKTWILGIANITRELQIETKLPKLFEDLPFPGGGAVVQTRDNRQTG